MRRYTGILMVIFLFVSAFAQAQILGKKIYPSGWVLGPTVAYQYQTKSFLKASFWGLTEVGYADYIKIDAGANFTWHDSKTHVIPELSVTYYPSTVLIWPFVEAEVTPYTVTPKVGVGIFNLFELGFGYGWSLQEKKRLGAIKGFNFSVALSLPLNFNL